MDIQKWELSPKKTAAKSVPKSQQVRDQKMLINGNFPNKLKERQITNVPPKKLSKNKKPH